RWRGPHPRRHRESLPPGSPTGRHPWRSKHRGPPEWPREPSEPGTGTGEPAGPQAGSESSPSLTRLSLLGLNRLNQEFDHRPNFVKLLLKLVSFPAQLVNIGSSTEPASRGVLQKAAHGQRGALLNTHLLAGPVAQLHAVRKIHIIHFLPLARHVFRYVASLDGHVQPVRVDLSGGPLLVADNLGGRNPVVLRQSRRTTAIRLQLLLRPRVTSGTRVLSLNTDRVDIPGQSRIGARARMPSLASGNHIPGTVPAQTQIGQRAFQVLAAVGHGALRRVVALRAGRSRRVMPDDPLRLVHSPVAAGLPP